MKSEEINISFITKDADHLDDNNAVSIQNGNFFWEDKFDNNLDESLDASKIIFNTKEFASGLRNISANIRKGSFIAIIGEYPLCFLYIKISLVLHLESLLFSILL